MREERRSQEEETNGRREEEGEEEGEKNLSKKWKNTLASVSAVEKMRWAVQS